MLAGSSKVPGAAGSLALRSRVGSESGPLRRLSKAVSAALQGARARGGGDRARRPSRTRRRAEPCDRVRRGRDPVCGSADLAQAGVG